jgi:hypothetical protein
MSIIGDMSRVQGSSGSWRLALIFDMGIQKFRVKEEAG